MGKFRDRASRKDERAHFGLAWSVLAAYFLAGSVFLRSFHESGWLMRTFDWLALAFFVSGAFAAYLALAVAMRWWPHQPKKLDMALIIKIESEIYFPALTMFSTWETNARAGVSVGGEIAALRNWIMESEKQLVPLLGRGMADRYRMFPDPTRIAPDWAQDPLWAAVEGRLLWLRAWLREQADL